MAKTVLVVDDNPDVRKLIGDLLIGYGYKVIEAANGQEALKAVHQRKPDVILLDTVLPYIDGNEVCRQIKKMEGMDAKVIVYTGHVDAVDAEKAREAGADDYVVKTSDLACLLEAIKNA